jgi:hypothetical protein
LISVTSVRIAAPLAFAAATAFFASATLIAASQVDSDTFGIRSSICAMLANGVPLRRIRNAPVGPVSICQPKRFE